MNHVLHAAAKDMVGAAKRGAAAERRGDWRAAGIGFDAAADAAEDATLISAAPYRHYWAETAVEYRAKAISMTDEANRIGG